MLIKNLKLNSTTCTSAVWNVAARHVRPHTHTHGTWNSWKP